jgi:class 3 adenylate cyclase
MPSERIQRQINRLLDEAEAAVARLDWDAVRAQADAVLALDPENADARTFLDAAVRAGAGATAFPSDIRPPASEPAAAPPSMPSSFAAGRYVVRAFLGEGAKKRVYLAHDTKLDRDVAFALIKTDGLDADGLVRVRREAQAMGRLGDHPHIVTVYDAGDEGGAPYIVSQYMPGGSVEDILLSVEHRRLTAERAMKIAVQISDGLAHAHAREIIHRDLKSGNVWLDADGNAALGDFGLALALDRSRMTVAGMMVGTVAYMAPEQALGRTPDARSDLYALGTMLYEMVAGRPPFLGDDAVGVISQHINTAPVAPTWHNPAVPRPLEALILRLLAKSPDERPASAQEVAQELRRVLSRSTEMSAIAPQPEAVSDLRGIGWGRFVGRRDEMEQLKAALEQALSGKVTLAFLAGEPGVGKTRLAEEFAVYAGLRGAQALTGRCFEGEQTIPYRPFVDALRQYVRARPDHELRLELGPGAPEIAQMVSEICQRLPDIQPAPSLDAEAERLRLFDSVAAFLRNASASQPVVVFLDDLHWVDKPSLMLLQHLARHTSPARLMVIATYRDVELDRAHPLSEALGALRRLPEFVRIAVRGLPEQDVYDLLTAIEPSEGLAEARHALASALWQETEGNPFFLGEVLAHLVETGKLRHEDGQWSAGVLTVSDLGLPEGVREVIGRRLSRLSDACNRMLIRASALTRGFSWDALRAINPDPAEDDLLDRLDEALAARIIAERKDETPTIYEFTHALIRQTLYEELSGPRRVLLHRRIGDALETLYAGNADAHVGELAYHFYQAAPGGDIEKAIDYCMRAGDRAAALNGHEDAVGHYERALQALDLGTTAHAPHRCELLLKLGDVQFKSGHPGPAMGTFNEAAALTRGGDSSRLFCQAAIGFAESSWNVAGDPALRPATVAMLSEALQALGDGDDDLRVRAMGLRTRAAQARSLSGFADALGTMGMGAYVGGRAAEQVAEAREGVDIARRLGDNGLLAYALGHLRGALWLPDNPQERLRISSEMLSEARLASDLALEFAAIYWQEVDSLDLGDLEGSKRAVAEGERLGGITRQPAHAWFPVIFKAARATIDGRFADAEQLATSALGIGQRSNTAESLLVFGVQLFVLRVFQGRSDELETLWKQQIAASPGNITLRAALAYAYAEMRRVEDARELYGPIARDGFSSIPSDFITLATMWLLARVIYFLDDRDGASALYGLLKPVAALPATVAGFVSVGSLHHPLGQLASVLGRWDDAVSHFETAIEWDERTGHVAVAPLTRQYCAAALLGRAAPGDRERALELIQQALDAGERMGCKPLVEDCLALKLQAQGVTGANIYTSIDAVAHAVERERRALPQQAVAPDGTVTIMFSDIEDSTVLTERLGDQAWQELLRKHNALIREQLRAHDGYEVKTMGDGFMVAFQSAKKGLDCAIAIQRAFDAHNAADGEHVRVRIGLHAGEAIKDGDDFYGKNVVLASRVAGEAVGGEILVSSLVRQLVESSVDAGTFGEPREIELKGLAGTHTLYAVRAP